jgi:hypothetical protein
MKITVPSRIRVAIYVLNVLGTPVVAYLLARAIIGPLEMTLWAAEVAAAFLLAGLNTPAAGAEFVTLKAHVDGDQLAAVVRRRGRDQEA